MITKLPLLPLLSCLLFCFPATAQKPQRDTTWLNGDMLLNDTRGADRYILKDTFLNGLYILKGFYTNGKIWKDGYAKRKRKGGGYTDGKIKWFKPDGSLDTQEEMTGDSAWAKYADGLIYYFSDGKYNTFFYENGMPAQRYHERLREFFRDDKFENDPLRQMMEKGLFTGGRGPEIELFYDNGQRALVVDMKKNLAVSYYENGVKAAELLPRENGYLHRRFYRNGKPYSEETLDKKYRINGPCYYYYADGVLREKGSRKIYYGDREYHEPVTEYYPNGKVYKITRYKKGNTSPQEEVKIDLAENIPDTALADTQGTYEYRREKVANPDEYVIFDINGKQLFQYNENDPAPADEYEQYTKQVKALLETQLTPEEKKYTPLEKKDLDEESTGRDEVYRYRLNGQYANGKYIIRTPVEIRFYTFKDGYVDNKKQYIAFDNDYGFNRYENHFPGIRYSHDILLYGKYYDDDKKMLVEENIITGTTIRKGINYMVTEQRGANKQWPNLHYHFVPRLTNVFKKPEIYLFIYSYSSLDIRYSPARQEEYKSQKRVAKEYLDNLERPYE